jgi:hypothetical protein
MEPRFGDHDSYAESGRSFKGNQEEVLPRASACSSPTIHGEQLHLETSEITNNSFNSSQVILCGFQRARAPGPLAIPRTFPSFPITEDMAKDWQE